MRMLSIFPALLCGAILISMTGTKAEAGCTHFGEFGTCPPGTHDGATSTSVLNNVITWDDGTTSTGACCGLPSAGIQFLNDSVNGNNSLWGGHPGGDPANNFAQGNNLVHVENDPNANPYRDGDYTFYGRDPGQNTGQNAGTGFRQFQANPDFSFGGNPSGVPNRWGDWDGPARGYITVDNPNNADCSFNNDCGGDGWSPPPITFGQCADGSCGASSGPSNFPTQSGTEGAGSFVRGQFPVIANGTGAAGSNRTYTVQRAENLYQIASRFGVSLNAIAAANGITNLTNVFVGQTLIIPGLPTIGSSAGNTGTTGAPPTQPRVTGTTVATDLPMRAGGRSYQVNIVRAADGKHYAVGADGYNFGEVKKSSGPFGGWRPEGGDLTPPPAPATTPNVTTALSPGSDGTVAIPLEPGNRLADAINQMFTALEADRQARQNSSNPLFVPEGFEIETRTIDNIFNSGITVIRYDVVDANTGRNLDAGFVTETQAAAAARDIHASRNRVTVTYSPNNVPTVSIKGSEIAETIGSQNHTQRSSANQTLVDEEISIIKTQDGKVYGVGAGGHIFGSMHESSNQFTPGKTIYSFDQAPIPRPATTAVGRSISKSDQDTIHRHTVSSTARIYQPIITKN